MAGPWEDYQDNAIGTEASGPWDEFSQDTEQAPVAEETRLGIKGTLWQGAKSAARALDSAGRTYTGNGDAVVDNAQAQQEAPKDYRLENFYADVQRNKEDDAEDAGLWDGIKNVGGAIADNPAGAGLAIVEQLPNSVPTLAGGFAGFKAGALAGGALGTAVPVVGNVAGAAVGGVIGGLTGMFIGNTAIETGHKAMAAADDGQFTPDEMDQVQREGAIKGGVITAIDGLTLGLGGKVASAMQRTATTAMETATRKVLVDRGIDVADEAAVLAARQSPEISAAVRAAQDGAIKATDTLKRRATEAGTLLGMESVGEGLGEYLGELAATGEADVTDAVMEAALSLGQSGAEAAWTISRSRGDRGQWEPAKIQPMPTADNPNPAPIDRPDPNAGSLSRAANLLPAPDTQGEVFVDGSGNASTNRPAWVNPENDPSAQSFGPGMDRQAGGNQPADGYDYANHDENILEGEIVTAREVFRAQRPLGIPDMRADNITVAPDGTAAPGKTPNTPPERYIQGGRGMDQQTPAGKTYSNVLAAKNAISKAAQPGALEVVKLGDKQFEVRPTAEAQEQTKPVLQNRDRSTPASITQMRGIAARPDYQRVSVSRDFANGAPVVEPGASIPASRKGRSEVVSTASGRKINAQYAVIEAADLLPSHDINGSQNADYENGAPGKSRAIAGNGRVTGISHAYTQGTASEYRRELEADAAGHGISPAAIKGMKSPVLVRIMPQDQITQDIGDESNTATVSALSAAEQASNDAKRIDPASMTFDESGEISEATVRQFILAMPEAERGGLLDGGRPSRQAYERAASAVFATAYESDELIRLQAQATDPESRTVLAGLLAAASKMARLKGQGQWDIRGLVVEAAQAAVNATRNGQTLADYAQQMDIERNPEATYFIDLFAANSRSGKRIGEELSAVADTFYAEASKSETDMFGAVPRRSRQELLGELNGAAEGQPGSAQPTGQQAGPGAIEASGQAAAIERPEQTSAGGNAQAETFQLNQQTEEELAAADAANKARIKAEEKAQAEADEKQRKADEAAFVKQQNEAANADFQLGQNAEDNLTGQGSIFDAPPAVAAPSATTAKPSEADAQRFITAPDGSTNFGEITSDMAKAAGRQAGKIRLQQGNDSWGLQHIEQRHGAEIRATGFADVPAFVADIAQHIDQVWKPAATRQLVALHKVGNNRMMFVELQPGKDEAGDFYTVNTAFTSRRAEKKGWKLLWEARAQASGESGNRPSFAVSPPIAGGEVTNPSSQSSEPSVAPPADAKPSAEPKAKIENFGEELQGKRKVMPKSLDAELTDEDIANQPLSKLWPPAEIDGMEDTFAAAVAMAARSEIPAKPRKGYKLNSWVGKVKALRGLAKFAAQSREGFIAKLKEFDGLAGFAAKVELLELIDRANWKRIGKVSEHPTAYRMEDGKKVTSPFVAIEIDDKRNQFGDAKTVGDALEAVNKLLGNEATGKVMAFEIRKDRTTHQYSINKTGDKEYRVLKEFATLTEARDFMRNNNADLVAAWDGVKDRDNVKKTDVRNAENRPRTGADHRKGKDVTPEMFVDTLGFRGVEFGNWVGQGANTKERQGMLNAAFDALVDLASIIGVQPKAISLNGTLGLAFGSRGKGNAAAHFEPGNLVINLTKTKGAGTLAHEWFHALDNYFARERGGEVPIKAGTNPQLAYRQQNFITYRPEPLYVHKTKHRGEPISKAKLEHYGKNAGPDGYYHPSNWHLDPTHPKGVRPVVETAFADLVKALEDSPMAKRASANDKGPDGYWGRIIERGARAFENFTISKMQEQGYSNDYLANVVEPSNFPRSADRYPYLLPEEMAPITEAFDRLFGTLESKEDSAGNVALFSRVSGATRDGVFLDRGAVQKAAIEAVGDVAVGFVYSSYLALPAEIKKSAKAMDIPPHEIRAVHWNGTTYLVDGRFRSALDVERAVYHEHYAHFGMRAKYGAALGPQLRTLLEGVGGLDGLRQLAEQQNIDLSAYEKAIAKDDKTPEHLKPLILMDELLAHVAESGGTLKRLIQEYVGMLRAWLRRMGYKNMAGMGVTDLAAELRGARKAAQQASKNAGSADVRFMFAGAEAATADQYSLDEAAARLEKGESATRVRLETGWSKGADNKWRFEIADDEAGFTDAPIFESFEDFFNRKERENYGARVSPSQMKAAEFTRWKAYRNAVELEYNARNGRRDLSGLLDHPKLFAAYPDLAGVQVSFPRESDSRGSYYPRYDSIEVALSADPEQMLSTLLHEVQHAIQHREGFAMGGNSDRNFADAVKGAVQRMKQTTREQAAMWRITNQSAIKAAEQAAETARYGLLFESATRLMEHSRRDRPSGVFRNIRNEMQWLYDPMFKGNEKARDLQYAFYEIPKPHNMDKRNAFISKMAFDAGQLFMEQIPAETRAQFKADTRTMKGMLNALEREARNKRKELRPLDDLNASERAAQAVYDSTEYATSYDIYRALAGEAEARNTQARQKMTDAERRAQSPASTLDVDASKLIVMFGGMDVHAPSVMASQAQPETIYIGSMFGDGTTRVLKNPTRNQALAFAKAAKHESMRGIVDPATGDLYLADSYAVDHKMLAEGVGLTWEDVRYSTDPETGSSNRLSIPANSVEFYPRPIFSGDQKNQSARYRLADGAAKGIPLFSARAIAKKVMAATGLNATVVNTEADLPADLQAQIKRDKATGRVAGIYHNGTAYLVASNLRDTQHAISVMLHEAVGHGGVQSVLGDKLGKVMRDIYRDMPKAMRNELERRYAGQMTGMSQAEAESMIAEEYVAHLAETDPQHGVVRRLVAMLRKFIRDTFGDAAALKWSRNDLVQLLAEAGVAARNDGKGPKGSSRYRDTEAVQALAALPEVSEADESAFVASLKGDAATRSFANAMYKARGTESPFFKAWFGKSRMVDKQGQPIAFVHRSYGERDTFTDADLGKNTGTPTATLGHFLARKDVDNVDRYGPVVEQFYIRMEKPKVITQAQFEAMGDWSLAKVQAYRKTLMEQGHDGLYIQGLAWPVVFEGKNIKAKRNQGTFDESASTRYSLTGARDLFDRATGPVPLDRNDPFAAENRRLREDDKTLWAKAKKVFARQFAPGGLLPEAVFNEKITRDSEFQAVEFDVRHLSGGLNKAVNADYGVDVDNLTAEQMKPLAEALTGKVDPAIPEATRVAIVAMRQYIDSLSGEYLEIIQGQIDALQEKAATYGPALKAANDARKALNAAIASDSDPAIMQALAGKKAALAAQVKAKKAMDGLKGEERAQAKAAYEVAVKAHDQAKAALRASLSPELKAQAKAAEALRAEANAARSSSAEAKAESALHDKISANLGAYVNRSYQAFDDPNWFKTVPTEVVNTARAYLANGYMEQGETAAEARRLADVTVNEMLKNGTAYDSMGAFIAEGKLGAKDLTVLIKRKEIAPEIRALLGEYMDPRLNFAKSATKMGRLVWNQRFLDRVLGFGMGTLFFEGKNRPADATTQIAGDQSETYAPLNGLWTFPEVAQAFQDALGKEQMSDLYRTVVRLNGMVKYGKTILSPTTAMRNWQSAMFFSLANGHFDLTQMKKSWAAMREQVTQNATGEDLVYLRKLKQLGVVYDTPYAGEMMALLQDARMDELLSSKSGTGLKWLRKANQFAQGFYSFGDDFWKIIGFENEKAGLLKAGIPLAEAEAMAAKRIRDTYPTYSMIGKAIQWLRRFPLVGTFVSFPSEIIRTSVNMLQLTAADLKSDNPGLRAIGRKRAAGIAMVSGGFYALAALTAAAAGVGDDEEEALRDLAAPWSKNSTFLYTGRDADGKLRYFDLSFLDPYGYWKRPLTAMMRDQPWEKAAASGLSDMLSPFFGADITAGAIFEVLANKKPTGGPVFNPDAGSVDQLQDITNHMRKALQPGFVSNAERLYLAGTESRREGSGQPYDMRDEMVSLLGWRASTLDTQTGLYYRSFDFTDALSNARKTLTRTLRSSNPVTDGEIGESKQAANAQYQQAFTEMGRLVSAAQAAGMTRAEVVQTLKTSGIAQANIMALVNGRVPPMQISLAAQAKAVKQARTMRDSEHAAEIARRFRLAREQ